MANEICVANDPNFAVICAFLEKFATLGGIEHPDFGELQSMLENNTEVSPVLIDFHIKLLRKCRYNVQVDRWERTLAKFCYTYSTNDAWEVERFGYRLLRLPFRLRILKTLIETQFDANPKFKAAVNALNATELRPQPLGRDKLGNAYWRTLDSNCNIRIYQENQDDESWRIVASNRDELAQLISVLSGNGPVVPNLQGLVDEDSSTNSEDARRVKEPPPQPQDDSNESDTIPNSNPAPNQEESKTGETQKSEGHLNKFNRPSLLSPSKQSDQKQSRISLTQTIDKQSSPPKINKIKLMTANNAKKSKYDEKNESDDDEEMDDEEMGEEEEQDDEEDGEEEEEVEEEESENETGSIIQERVVYIKGEGSGKDCNAGNPLEFSEVIEEDVQFVFGEGSGRDCDVGNPSKSGEEPRKEEPAPMFFFGRPGCLNLSPMRSEPVKKEPPTPATKPRISLVEYDDSNSSNLEDDQNDTDLKKNSEEVKSGETDKLSENKSNSETVTESVLKDQKDKESEDESSSISSCPVKSVDNISKSIEEPTKPINNCVESEETNKVTVECSSKKDEDKEEFEEDKIGEENKDEASIIDTEISLDKEIASSELENVTDIPNSESDKDQEEFTDKKDENEEQLPESSKDDSMKEDQLTLEGKEIEKDDVTDKEELLSTEQPLNVVENKSEELSSTSKDINEDRTTDTIKSIESHQEDKLETPIENVSLENETNTETNLDEIELKEDNSESKISDLLPGSTTNDDDCKLSGASEIESTGIEQSKSEIVSDIKDPDSITVQETDQKQSVEDVGSMAKDTESITIPQDEILNESSKSGETDFNDNKNTDTSQESHEKIIEKKDPEINDCQIKLDTDTTNKDEIEPLEHDCEEQKENFVNTEDLETIETPLIEEFSQDTNQTVSLVDPSTPNTPEQKDASDFVNTEGLESIEKPLIEEFSQDPKQAVASENFASSNPSEQKETSDFINTKDFESIEKPLIEDSFQDSNEVGSPVDPSISIALEVKSPVIEEDPKEVKDDHNENGNTCPGSKIESTLSETKEESFIEETKLPEQESNTSETISSVNNCLIENVDNTEEQPLKESEEPSPESEYISEDISITNKQHDELMEQESNTSETISSVYSRLIENVDKTEEQPLKESEEPSPESEYISEDLSITNKQHEELMKEESPPNNSENTTKQTPKSSKEIEILPSISYEEPEQTVEDSPIASTSETLKEEDKIPLKTSDASPTEQASLESKDEASNLVIPESDISNSLPEDIDSDEKLAKESIQKEQMPIAEENVETLCSPILNQPTECEDQSSLNVEELINENEVISSGVVGEENENDIKEEINYDTVVEGCKNEASESEQICEVKSIVEDKDKVLPVNEDVRQLEQVQCSDKIDKINTISDEECVTSEDKQNKLSPATQKELTNESEIVTKETPNKQIKKEYHRLEHPGIAVVSDSSDSDPESDNHTDECIKYGRKIDKIRLTSSAYKVWENAQRLEYVANERYLETKLDASKEESKECSSKTSLADVGKSIDLPKSQLTSDLDELDKTKPSEDSKEQKTLMIHDEETPINKTADELQATSQIEVLPIVTIESKTEIFNKEETISSSEDICNVDKSNIEKVSQIIVATKESVSESNEILTQSGSDKTTTTTNVVAIKESSTKDISVGLLDDEPMSSPESMPDLPPSPDYSDPEENLEEDIELSPKMSLEQDDSEKNILANIENEESKLEEKHVEKEAMLDESKSEERNPITNLEETYETKVDQEIDLGNKTKDDNPESKLEQDSKDIKTNSILIEPQSSDTNINLSNSLNDNQDKEEEEAVIKTNQEELQSEEAAILKTDSSDSKPNTSVDNQLIEIPPQPTEPEPIILSESNSKTINESEVSVSKAEKSPEEVSIGTTRRQTRKRGIEQPEPALRPVVERKKITRKRKLSEEHSSEIVSEVVSGPVQKEIKLDCVKNNQEFQQQVLATASVPQIEIKDKIKEVSDKEIIIESPEKMDISPIKKEVEAEANSSNKRATRRTRKSGVEPEVQVSEDDKIHAVEETIPSRNVRKGRRGRPKVAKEVPSIDKVTEELKTESEMKIEVEDKISVKETITPERKGRSKLVKETDSQNKTDKIENDPLNLDQEEKLPNKDVKLHDRRGRSKLNKSLMVEQNEIEKVQELKVEPPIEDENVHVKDTSVQDRKGRSKTIKEQKETEKEVKLETELKNESSNMDIEEALPQYPIKKDGLEENESETTKEKEEEVSIPTKGKRGRRKKNNIMGLNIDEVKAVEQEAADGPPVRQSRRIAQLKIREESERRLQEEIALQKMKENAQKKTNEPKEESSAESNSEDDKKGKKKKLKLKEKKPKLTWHSGSNTSDSEQEEEEDDDGFGVVEEDVGSPLFRSDHEFSPESDLEEDGQTVPTKMARTVRKGKDDDDEESDDNPDHACQKCSKHDHPEWILLCDNCDKGYHCSCLIPVLFIIPEGDWFCPTCQHAKLLENLNAQLEELDLMIKKREREETRLKRLAFTNISQENVLPPEPKPETKSKSVKSSSENSESGSNTDSDDVPIYKLRKRKQTTVSYRFNEYDDLINSAIHDDMADNTGFEHLDPSVKTERQAGNLGRGKDISTIIEAEHEKEKSEKSGDESEEKKSDISDNEDVGPLKKKRPIIRDDSDDSEPIRPSGKIKQKKMKKKKNRKLNNLDLSSDDDGSDEDFEGSSPDSEDTNESISSGSESSMELELLRKKKRKDILSARRSVRTRVKRYDEDFINDDEDSDEEKKKPPKRIKKKKEESDFSEDLDDEDDEDEDEEDVDSDDLCDDTDTDSDNSDRPWGSKKKNKSSSKKPSARNSLPSGKGMKRPKKKFTDDNEKSFRMVITKKKEESDDDEKSGSEKQTSRRTRGKKINFLEDIESDDSEDGIKPGVKRPDTPPEEREQFIKKQEEIKRMLAAKNNQAALQAATPKLEPLKLKLSGLGPSKLNDPESLSTVPLQVIQTAKALDVDYHKNKDPEDNSDFDDDLPDDFNPEDMDEEEIAKMMEEEDFAHQQLKLAGEVIRNKKLKEVELKKEEDKTRKSIILETPSISIPAIPPPQAQPPSILLAHGDSRGDRSPIQQPIRPPPTSLPSIPPQSMPHSVIQGLNRPPLIPPHLHMMHQNNFPGQRLPLLPNQIRIPHPQPTSVPQNVIVSPQQLQRPHLPIYPPPYASPQGPPAPVQPTEEDKSNKMGLLPKKRGRKTKPEELVIPTPVQLLKNPPTAPTTSASVLETVLNSPPLPVQQSDPDEDSPVKKRGRRKKVTPLRDDLPTTQNNITGALKAEQTATSSTDPKPAAHSGPPTSILSERLEAAGDPKLKPMVSQAYNPGMVPRLPQPPHTLPSQFNTQGLPPRYFPPQGIGQSSLHIGLHHLQQRPAGPHGDERMHFVPQAQRLPPSHLFRPQGGIYGGPPFQGQPPPHLQRPQIDPHTVRGLHPQDYSNTYLPPQFGPYMHPSHPNPAGGGRDDPAGKTAKSKAGPPPPAHGQSPLQHLSQFNTLKPIEGSPQYANPSENQESPGEFSGLVSYFSSQHDDLE